MRDDYCQLPVGGSGSHRSAAAAALNPWCVACRRPMIVERRQRVKWCGVSRLFRCPSCGVSASERARAFIARAPTRRHDHDAARNPHCVACRRRMYVSGRQALQWRDDVAIQYRCGG